MKNISLYNKIYWRIRIFIFSFRWIFKINLGDYVWYNGDKYIVANGVRCNSWRLSGLNNNDDGWVKRNECRKSWTPKNIMGSFKSGWRFYMGYWYHIWANGSNLALKPKWKSIF